MRMAFTGNLLSVVRLCFCYVQVVSRDVVVVDDINNVMVAGRFRVGHDDVVVCRFNRSCVGRDIVQASGDDAFAVQVALPGLEFDLFHLFLWVSYVSKMGAKRLVIWA